LFELELLTDLFGTETSWELKDTTANNVIAESEIAYGEEQLYNEQLCLTDGPCFKFTIYDSFNDGICCEWGEGYYSVTVDGEIVGSGGDFSSDETVDFCTFTGGCEDSPLPVSYQGPKTCEDIANFGGCNFAAAQSHCPDTCNACATYECADSTVPWIFFNRVFRCSQLANLPPNEITDNCDTWSELSATCRQTCGIC